MKIYIVTFNDGGWHTSRPEHQVVAETKEEAIEFVINEFIVRNAFAILTKNNNTTVANTKSKTYYKIIKFSIK
jgi:hypothetical protein